MRPYQWSDSGERFQPYRADGPLIRAGLAGSDPPFGEIEVDFIDRASFLRNKRATGRLKDLSDIEGMDWLTAGSTVDQKRIAFTYPKAQSGFVRRSESTRFPRGGAPWELQQLRPCWP